MHTRLLAWWKDDATDPGRAILDQPDVRRLIAGIAPGARAIDLDGVMSLNVRLEPAGLVLRVHQPFATRARLGALQEVRRRLVDRGLVAPLPVPWRGETVFRCGSRWAELEEFIPHESQDPSPAAYAWLFGAMGSLHRELAALDLAVPRPLVATYAPPGSLRRWLAVTEAAVRHDREAAKVARLLHDLVNELRRQWVPAAGLPAQLVHGDVRLRNVCRKTDGTAVYLDFGFVAHRPRVHDVAYALTFMLWSQNQDWPPEHFDRRGISAMVEAYESAGGRPLTGEERRALVPYAAAVPLYAAALDGFTEDPVGKLRGRLAFVRLSEWLLGQASNVIAPRAVGSS